MTISCQPDGRPPQPVRPWKSGRVGPTFSRGQQYTIYNIVVLKLPYSTEFGRERRKFASGVRKYGKFSHLLTHPVVYGKNRVRTRWKPSSRWKHRRKPFLLFRRKPHLHRVQKKGATDFFCCRPNFCKYWRIFIIFRAQLHKRMPKSLTQKFLAIHLLFCYHTVWKSQTQK